MQTTKRVAGTEAHVTTVPFTVTAKQHVVNEYNLYLHGVIKDPADFIDSLHLLAMAEEQDICIIHINSGGGSLEATDSLIDAIEQCKAKVVAKVTGVAASAATAVLLSVDEFYLSPRATMMVHAASFGYGGVHGQVVDYVNFANKQLRSWLYDTYGGMFTDLEFEQMIGGKDFWMTPDEFSERFEKRNDYLEKQMQEEVKKQRKQAQQLKRNQRTQQEI